MAGAEEALAVRGESRSDRDGFVGAPRQLV